MKLFKKKEKCSCGNMCEISEDNNKKNELDKKTRIKILGTGCDKCKKLEKNTEEALKNMNKTENIAHITDFIEIAKYGVMSTPALVLDEKVLSSGKVLSSFEVEEILKKNI